MPNAVFTSLRFTHEGLPGMQRAAAMQDSERSFQMQNMLNVLINSVSQRK